MGGCFEGVVRVTGDTVINGYGILLVWIEFCGCFAAVLESEDVAYVFGYEPWVTLSVGQGYATLRC